MAYLRENFENSLHDNQHGFRSGLSCVTQLAATVHDIWAQVDKHHSIQVVALDFAKAFDKVSHDILISKLLRLKLNSSIVRWIASFLADRKQVVFIEGQKSQEILVSSGVPQGSVLRPVLLLFYVNDMFSAVKSATLKLYADDALLYLPLDSMNNRRFQVDLDCLSLWADANKMQFNTKKCYSIFFSREQYLPTVEHRLSGNVLQRVLSIKYLGVTLSENLSWNLHISNTVAKAYCTLGLIKKICYGAPDSVKLAAYKVLCRSQLEYASKVWDPFTKTNTEKIEMVQHWTLRFICNLKGICSIEEARKSVELDTLEERRRASRRQLFLRILAGENVHESLSRCFPGLVATVQGCQTRASLAEMPQAFSANYDGYLHSFIPRTSREIRFHRY